MINPYVLLSFIWKWILISISRI